MGENLGFGFDQYIYIERESTYDLTTSLRWICKAKKRKAFNERDAPNSNTRGLRKERKAADTCACMGPVAFQAKKDD